MMLGGIPNCAQAATFGEWEVTKFACRLAAATCRGAFQAPCSRIKDFNPQPNIN